MYQRLRCWANATLVNDADISHHAAVAVSYILRTSRNAARPIAMFSLPQKLVAAAFVLALSPAAFAGVTFSMERPAASPGETVRLKALYFNDGTAGATFNSPAQVVLQWRGADGTVVRSLAQSAEGASPLNIPVNNFAAVYWDVVVPKQVRGLQAIAIEGQPALLALDTSGRDSNTPATLPAQGPVIDPQSGSPVPDAELARIGASPDSGPAPVAVARQNDGGSAAFDRFRSSISEYEPVYFSVGTRGMTTARFQLSAKYRLFNPAIGTTPTFAQNLYLAYTQRSLWDLDGDSKPFIDTTFNPSAFWLNDNLWTSANKNWRFGSQVGVQHYSNGKDGEDSRSVNDAFLQPAIHYQFDNGSTLSFAPKYRSYFKVASDNPDYSDFAGHVDLNLRYAQAEGAVFTAMYRQGKQQRRTTQLDFAWPLKKTWLDMNGYLHFQYFNGYGETLLGYNERNKSQFRIGLSLVP